jgi:hypothetical protein
MGEEAGAARTGYSADAVVCGCRKQGASVNGSLEGLLLETTLHTLRIDHTKEEEKT